MSSYFICQYKSFLFLLNQQIRPLRSLMKSFEFCVTAIVVPHNIGGDSIFSLFYILFPSPSDEHGEARELGPIPRGVYWGPGRGPRSGGGLHGLPLPRHGSRLGP